MFRIGCVFLLFGFTFVQSVCVAEEIPLQPRGADKHNGIINFVAFSADGSRFGTCSRDQTIRIWDSETCKLIHVLTLPERGNGASLESVAFSPDGKLVASFEYVGKYGNHRKLALWNAETGKFLRHSTETTKRGTAIVSDCKFTPDGSQVWVCDGPSVYQWDVASGSAKQYFVDDMIHGRMRFRRDKSPLVVYGMAKLHVLDPASGQRYFGFSGETLIWGDVYSPNRFVAISQRKRDIVLGNTRSSSIENRFNPQKAGAGWIRLLNGSNELLVFTMAGYIERWDLNETQCTGLMPQPIGASLSFFRNFKFKYGQANSMVFGSFHPTPIAVSPDNSRMAVVSGYQFAIIPLDWQEP